MKQKILIILITVVLPILLFNCSDVQNDISSPNVADGVHPAGFGKVGSTSFHSFTIKANNYDLTPCQECHGSDYSGGLTGVSCLTCHTESAGPEACNTCHGDFADPSRIAPPVDVSGNTSTLSPGVGAHTSHVYENNLSLGVGCFDCHPKDDSNGDFVKTHINGLPAQVSVSGFDQYALTCANNYCHGNFEFSKDEATADNQWAYTGTTINGNNFTPVWNKVDGTQAKCGTCHGRYDDSGNIITPLPVGHWGNFKIDDCKVCHTAAYNADGTLNKYAHINGKRDLN